MFTRASCRRIVALGVCLSVVGPAAAEIVSIAGAAQATVQEYRAGSLGESDQASATYSDADPTATLPLQVVAHLLAADDEAAGSAAAQFADPRDLAQPNPEEFAINLALLTTSDDIRYSATAMARETRTVRFTTADFPTRADGDTVSLTGLLFVDGALAIFSPTRGVDLTDAEVLLTITIVQQTAGQADQTVFSGSVALRGGSNGSVQHTASGDFPTLTLIRTNLAVFVDDFDLFEVLLIPRMTISYDYEAVLGQEVTLQTTVQVTASNAEGEVGVAAVIGAPVDSIQQVIAAVSGDSAATKTITALQQERENPTGEPAFPAATTQPLFPLCGWFGLEGLLGCAALADWRRGRWYPRRRPLS